MKSGLTRRQQVAAIKETLDDADAGGPCPDCGSVPHGGPYPGLRWCWTPPLLLDRSGNPLPQELQPRNQRPRPLGYRRVYSTCERCGVVVRFDRRTGEPAGHLEPDE